MDFNRDSVSECKRKRAKRKESRKNKCKKSKALSVRRDSGYCIFDKKRIMNIYDKKTVPTWYWSNYYKAQEWHHRSRAMLWKSYAFALQEENKYLLDLLRGKKSDTVLDVPLGRKNLNYRDKFLFCDNNRKSSKGEKYRKWENVRNSEEVASCESEGVSFEISEEMIKFFEQSIKHKLDLKKSKKVLEEAESQVKDVQEVHYQRAEEVKLLYGEASSMIAGMETAVQLSYDKYCDLKSPKYWPNIPLNL